MTIRSRVAELGALLQGDPTPAQVRDAEQELAGRLPNIAKAVREADIAYKRVLLDAFRVEGTQNRAKLVAETQPEFAAWQEAKDTERAVMEMIRTCRSTLKSLDGEMRLAR